MHHLLTSQRDWSGEVPTRPWHIQRTNLPSSVPSSIEIQIRLQRVRALPVLQNLLHSLYVWHFETSVPICIFTSVDTHNGHRTLSLRWNPVRLKARWRLRSEVNINTAVRIQLHIGFIVRAKAGSLLRAINKRPRREVVDNQRPELFHWHILGHTQFVVLTGLKRSSIEHAPVSGRMRPPKLGFAHANRVE